MHSSKQIQLNLSMIRKRSNYVFYSKYTVIKIGPLLLNLLFCSVFILLFYYSLFSTCLLCAFIDVVILVLAVIHWKFDPLLVTATLIGYFANKTVLVHIFLITRIRYVHSENSFTFLRIMNYKSVLPPIFLLSNSNIIIFEHRKKKYSGIVSFVTSPLEGRFIVFSQ